VPICDFYSLFPPCTEADLRQLQQDLDVKLPEDYLDFLRQTNGMWLKPFLAFPFPDAFDEEDEGWVQMFFGVASPSTERDLREEQRGYAFCERVPRTIIAIGSSVDWDRVCLSVAPTQFGCIYAWEPGEPWEPDNINVPTTRWLRFVAPTFARFWDSLYVPQV
jgi:hypothetical protein